jgi:hypothetical protein
MSQTQFTLLTAAVFVLLFAAMIGVLLAGAIPLSKYAIAHKLEMVGGLMVGAGVSIALFAILFGIAISKVQP